MLSTLPTVARRIVLASRPGSQVTPENFRLEEYTIPPLLPGQVLVQTLFLSLDPYMRARMIDSKSYAAPTAVDAVMPGESVARVLSADCAGLEVGTIVLARTGWQTHSCVDGAGLRRLDPNGVPLSAALGVLGMPGFTAYSGMRMIGQPEAGETVVVAAATGPVGALVGQLARRAGARAVGIAGGPEKCALLLSEFGFDAAVDHRAADFAQALAAACPDGVDVYFENVGGAVWTAVAPLLNQFARIPVCGLVGQFGVDAMAGPDRLPATMRDILSKSLTVRGFINYDFNAIFPDFLEDIGSAFKAGTIRHLEDVVIGLENAPAAFIGMLKGENRGKLLVRFPD